MSKTDKYLPMRIQACLSGLNKAEFKDEVTQSKEEIKNETQESPVLHINGTSYDTKRSKINIDSVGKTELIEEDTFSNSGLCNNFSRNISRGASTVYNKLFDKSGKMSKRRISTDGYRISQFDPDHYAVKEVKRSPKYSDVEHNISDNLSPKSFLKSIYNRSDWSVLKNVQLKIPNIEKKTKNKNAK